MVRAPSVTAGLISCFSLTAETGGEGKYNEDCRTVTLIRATPKYLPIYVLIADQNIRIDVRSMQKHDRACYSPPCSALSFFSYSTAATCSSRR